MKAEFLDAQKEEENYLVCESCGFKMDESGCKLKCKKCHYFRSCSDLF